MCESSWAISPTSFEPTKLSNQNQGIAMPHPLDSWLLQKKDFKHPLIRACGLAKQTGLRILDSTAGLGREAFLLAQHGGCVTALEPSAWLYEFTQAEYQRLLNQGLNTQITLLQQSQLDYLTEDKSDRFDVIYLDPMFEKGALKGQVKQYTQVLRQLAIETSTEDTEAFFQKALSCAKQKVIVKRAAKAKPLADKAATFSIKSKTSRFDIYQVG